MFAPRHEVAAREPRPGGRLGVCSWTPEGAVGDFFRTGSGHLPDPPPVASPPPLWGFEPHVRRLFAGTGVDVAFERGNTAGDGSFAEPAEYPMVIGRKA